jgi:hypothetical protein
VIKVDVVMPQKFISMAHVAVGQIAAARSVPAEDPMKHSVSTSPMGHCSITKSPVTYYQVLFWAAPLKYEVSSTFDLGAGRIPATGVYGP